MIPTCIPTVNTDGRERLKSSTHANCLFAPRGLRERTYLQASGGSPGNNLELGAYDVVVHAVPMGPRASGFPSDHAHADDAHACGAHACDDRAWHGHHGDARLCAPGDGGGDGDGE